MFKEQLYNALHTAVQNFNTSLDPNEAVVKAAEQYNFNTDQTRRLVETFNTARTIYHYKTAADRTVPFKLADADTVIPALFKDKKEEKASSANRDYSSYDIPEVDYRNGINVKAASAVNDTDTGKMHEFVDTHLDRLGEQAFRTVHIQRELSKTANDEARLSGNKSAEIIGKIASSISVGYTDVCQDKYDRLVSGYKDQPEFAPVITKLAEFVPVWMVKSYKPITDFIDDSDLTAQINLMKEAKTWMETEAELLAISGQMDKEASAFEREWLESIAPIMPEAQLEKTASDFLSGRLLKVAQTSRKTTSKYEGTSILGTPYTEDVVKEHKSTLGPMLSDILSESVKKPLADELSRNFQSAMEAPTMRENKKLSDRLKNAQREILLQDLIANDQVLSEQDPHIVAQAYTTLWQLAPDLSMNKEVTRAILRQAVHSVAMGPYEAQTITDVEKSIRQITGKAPIPGVLQQQGGRK